MTTTNAIRIFYQLSLMIGLASCNFINPDDPVPTYIKIDSIQVAVTADQGTASNKIKDVWAYMDGQMIGVYELPALFPVVGDAGKHSFSFLPGIYDNGIAATHTIYRLMQGAAMDISLINGATVSPPSPVVFSYFPGILFTSPQGWIEDFEDGTLSIVPVSGDTLRYETDPLKRFEGNASGKITMDVNNPSFRFEMFEGIKIPAASVSYLELNYKCDQPFFVGLKGDQTSGNPDREIILVNASPTWNKIYVSLGTAVRSLNGSSTFKIYCRSALSDGITSGTFYFDNFKLLHN